MALIDDFFVELDEKWGAVPARLRLSIIGCGALVLQTDYDRGTKDSDILETTNLGAEAAARLEKLAGRDSEMHQRRRHYVDVVGNGIPFLPEVPSWHPLDALNERLRSLELVALDVTDVCVAKLKPFRAQDKDDVDAMIRRGLVAHEKFVERFQSAFLSFSYDARAYEALPRFIANLHEVERDMFVVDETDIEIPSYVG